MAEFLTDDCKITKLADQATAATSAVECASVDMQADGGWESVLFLTSFATAAANNLMKAQASDDDGVSDGWSDIAGSAVDVAGASDEDQVLDIYQPPKRYIRPYLSRGTSTASGDVWAILYRGRRKPYTNALAGTIAVTKLSAPAEGTA